MSLIIFKIYLELGFFSSSGLLAFHSLEYIPSLNDLHVENCYYSEVKTALFTQMAPFSLGFLLFKSLIWND